ncbi:DNA topoisomerase 2-associated protein pat1 [Recurvomyces mirabilis]|uniref:DNA topoisomerase 2-associated protein pat1 n=1 Tax=Recurvomyces mirabilis TaxID=574656 RepID=A0AAE1C4H6_9PEZI|nr:DNA topoisomerase 2-associated protein pat1 [Recurvomyces mirabilis]KAK5160419.1 DNA topoisomerase 2-associated protein pat1 [Recurvomyces mirabilis]
MSFFGFDTTLPRDRQQQRGSRGMFEQHDPFAGLSRDGGGDEDEVLNFDDTYDGLGQRLQESGDTFNDDTFGGDEPVTRQSLGRDFDFAGQTATARGNVMHEQGVPLQQHQQQQHQPSSYSMPSRPARTGYEAYKQPDYLPKLEADASIWGAGIGKKAATAPQEQQASPDSSAARKMMSLEEVEAMMRAQSQPTPPVQENDRQAQGLRDMLGVGSPAPQQMPPHEQQQQRPVQILQRPQHQEPPMQDQSLRAPQILQRQSSPQPPRPQSQHFHNQPPRGQFQQQQQTPQGAPAVQPPRGAPQHQRGPSYNGPPITQAQQMMQMSDDERQTYMAEEAKRAKRNHKIFLLSKNNGLMTPQDKNFITRIQLQQLLTATGGIDNEPGSEEQLAEDFYYQVYAQIRGGPRNGPGQPLNQFAQTYLFQTGSRYGYGRSRHHPRGGDNHVQRMEQQVARAVEAAKARPKNKQLVMEGSLGKIAFSNSKTPRPLLNLKRPDSESRIRQIARAAIFDRKAALRDIERVYSCLMRLEDHERKLPAPPNEDSPPDVIEGHMRWRSDMQELNQQLWEAMKVMEPIQQNPTTPHPFIQILAHSKGKKVIPRVFRHLDDNQRLTMLTLIAIHLDIVDVIRDAYPPAHNAPLPPKVKEEVEIFSQAVMPPLFSYVNEAPLNIIIGLLGLVLDRVHVPFILRTKIGVSILTMLVSRAELVKQSQQSSPQNTEDWNQWSTLYTRLFDNIEPILPFIFPTDTNVSASDDVHVWQFLAAMGVGASPDQQQRLVLGVKERVMETVAVGRGLPEEMRERRLGEVNLFMRAIGLDVELLG